MKLAISQSNYIPWIGYFKLINSADVFMFYDQVQYTKNDWRNRNKIISKGKPQWISIPVRYRFSERKNIDQIELPETGWEFEHLRKIEQSYRETRHYSKLGIDLNEILSAKNANLSELNVKIIKRYLQELEIDTKIMPNSAVDINIDRSKRLIDLCIANACDEYLTTPKALDYLNTEAFERSKIKISILDFESCLEGYEQGSNNFDPYVSFIDVLFRTGPEEFLKRISSSA